jgi:hypothetical protein
VIAKKISSSYDLILIEHLFSAHIHSIECSWRLADVLACSMARVLKEGSNSANWICEKKRLAFVV